MSPFKKGGTNKETLRKMGIERDLEKTGLKKDF